MIDPLFFQPITIGSLEIKNRIFMPAMHMSMCRDFMVTEQLVEFYSKRPISNSEQVGILHEKF